VSDVSFYLLAVVIAFGVYYSVYGLGIAAVRSIRFLYEYAARTRWRLRRSHLPTGKM
jgi:hypothetical protein